MSKGSKPRPLSVPRDEYASAWERTFGRDAFVYDEGGPTFGVMAEVAPPKPPHDLTTTYLLGD